MGDLTKLDEELLSQLHEQYAINDNAKNQNFITFLISIFALLGAYGYVYIYTYTGTKIDDFNSEFVQSFCSIEYFHPNVLITITVIIVLIFTFMAMLVAFLGYSTRRDQIVIYKIRTVALKGDKVFYNNLLYTPFNKSYWEFIPDYYNLFFWAFVAINLLLIILLNIRLWGVNSQCVFVAKNIQCLSVSFLFWVIFIFIPILKYRCKLFKKYEKLDENKNKLK